MPSESDVLDFGDTSSPPQRFSWQLITFIVVLALEFLALENLWIYGFHVRDVAIRVTVFCSALFFFGRARLRRYASDNFSIHYIFAFLHLAVIGAMVLLAKHFSSSAWTPRRGALFSILTLLLVLTLLTTLVPLRNLWQMSRSLGVVWIYAALCWKMSVYVRGFIIHNAWDDRASRLGHALQIACLSGSSAVLRVFYPVVISDPTSMILGTNHFLVFISGVCSGIEGLALVLVLTVVWLIFTRKEMRLVRSVMLIPVALIFVWLMNIVRVAMLVMIGSAGHPRIADKGFHTEAGWITFNMASLGFLFVAQRVAWFRKDGGVAADAAIVPPTSTAISARNPTAVFLAPFLAITAASMISQAASGGFEWLYPLRLLAALAALYLFRRQYRSLDWRFGVTGVLGGVAIGVLWIGIHYGMAGWHLQPGRESIIGLGLLRLTTTERAIWIITRALTAVVAVPIAEELAFRGFAARRILSANFEDVPFTRLTVLSIAISSALFGVMHGRMWFAGVIAGVVFAVVAKLRGRLGEAVMAHAIANLAITIVVLATGDFSLW